MSGDVFSVEWSGFRARIQNREFRIVRHKVGESVGARKTVQVAESRAVFQFLLLPVSARTELSWSSENRIDVRLRK